MFLLLLKDRAFDFVVSKEYSIIFFAAMGGFHRGERDNDYGATTHWSQRKPGDDFGRQTVNSCQYRPYGQV